MLIRDKPQHFAPARVPVRQDWLDRIHEPIIEPDLPIIDAHHHLWNRPAHRYLLDELLADTGSGHNIRGTVFVQCRSMYKVEGPPELRPVGETEFVNGIAAQSASGIHGDIRVGSGIVGLADLAMGERARDVLEAHVRAAPDRFRGIRTMVASHPSDEISATFGRPPAKLMGDPIFRQGFAQLQSLGLSYDAWVYHNQLGELCELAQSFPDTPIVVNHVGGLLGLGPYRNHRDVAFREWRAYMDALAALPNVYVKLGGLCIDSFGFRLDERPVPAGSAELAAVWKPYVHRCIESFGANRCMFESNFPVDKGTTSYALLWNAFKRMAAEASAAEKRDLFFGTASRFYRLPEL